MSKKTTRVICLVLAVLLVLSFVAMIIPVRAVTQAEIDQLQAQRDRIKSQQEDIQEQIEDLQAEMASVVDRKAALDQRNALNEEDIRLINQQIELYDTMIRDKAVELSAAEEAEQTQYAHYRARVRTMEETNGWTYVAILLKATDLTDFLSRLNDVADIVRNDQNLKEEYIAAREAVEQVKAEYEAIQEDQKDKRVELETERARLEQQIRQANNLITMLEDDLDAYEAAFDAKEAEKDEIQSRIDAKVEELRKQKEAEEAARRAYEEALERQRRQQQLEQQRQQQAAQQQQQSSVSSTSSSTAATTTASTGSSGYYTWPVGTTYIPSRHGYRVHPIFGTTKYHAGVDIGAGSGATITAAAGGTVQISEYSDSYGYYCVIYHSNGTTTLYAHMNSMPVVAVGDTVTAGQTIGYVGSTGWANGPHLHFEVRVNGSSVDPLSYYAGTSFSYASDA